MNSKNEWDQPDKMILDATEGQRLSEISDVLALVQKLSLADMEAVVFGAVVKGHEGQVLVAVAGSAEDILQITTAVHNKVLEMTEAHELLERTDSDHEGGH